VEDRGELGVDVVLLHSWVLDSGRL
jgi:hypothetical protein